MTSRDRVPQVHTTVQTVDGEAVAVKDQLGPVIGTVVAYSPAVQHDINTVYTVKNAAINATASGDTTVVSAVSGKKIRAFSIALTVSAQVDVAWKTGGGDTQIAAMSFAQYGGMNQDYLPGWFVESDSGEALLINLSGAANVRGMLNYIEV